MGLLSGLTNFAFWKKKRVKGGNLLALDIGTEFVKVLVFSVPENEDGDIKILSATKERQKMGDMQAGAVVNLDGVISTCRRAIEKVKNEAGVEVEKAIVGIAGEFVWGKTVQLCYVRENPQNEINEQEFRNIVQKLQWRAFEQIRRQSTEETGVPELEIKLINASIAEILIDGYRVASPINFCGKEMCLSIFNAYAPLIHLGALQTIVDNLGLELCCVAVEPYSIVEAVGFNHNEGAIIIDIGGGTTDIALIRRGVLEGTKSFALGGRAFTRRLAQKLNIGLDEAEEIKIKYTQKKLSMSVTKKLADMFKKDIDVWLGGVEYCLKEFPQTQLLPRQILLCGGGSLMLGIKKALESKEWIKDLPFPDLPQVHYLEVGDIKRIDCGNCDLSSSQDITPLSLTILSIELNKEKEVLGEAIGQAVKLIQK